MVRLNFSQQNRNESHKLSISVSHQLLQDIGAPLLSRFTGCHVSARSETDEKQEKNLDEN